tara:strand:- start:57 stop:206 length:150 start_codon:yes stop_codon:yes gene_type:complete
MICQPDRLPTEPKNKQAKTMIETIITLALILPAALTLGWIAYLLADQWQ